jgi:hypothetical protein
LLIGVHGLGFSTGDTRNRNAPGLWYPLPV